jgi:hypothetical protein
MTNISTSAQEASVAAKQARHLEASDHNDHSQPIQSAPRRAHAKTEDMPDPLGLPDHLEITPAMDRDPNRKENAMNMMTHDEQVYGLNAEEMFEVASAEYDGGQQAMNAIRRAYDINAQAPEGLTVDIGRSHDREISVNVLGPGSGWASFPGSVVMGAKIPIEKAQELLALADTINNDVDLRCSNFVVTFDVSLDAKWAARAPKSSGLDYEGLLETAARVMRAALLYWIAATRYYYPQREEDPIEWEDLCKAMQEMAATMQPSSS